MGTQSVWDDVKRKITSVFRLRQSANVNAEVSGSHDETEPTPIEESNLEVTVETTPSESSPVIARVEIRAEIPVGTALHFSITAQADGQVVVSEHSRTITGASPAPLIPHTEAQAAKAKIQLPQVTLPRLLNKNWTAWLSQHAAWVFGAMALFISLVLIAWRLEDFPIYFFGDEAYQVLFAETLIKNNFLAANPQGIPIYIEAAGNRWTPMISTYLHAITLSLFGKSTLVTRLTTGLVGLAGIAAAGFALKEIFKSKLWWLSTLVALSMPAWLLHDRTGFETVMSTGFYGGFALFYLLYRYRSPQYIYGALGFGAAVFYSYSNAQAIMATAGLMLFLADIRYHWQNRGVLAKGLVFAVVLAIPLIIFRIKEPGAISEHMRTVNSFIVQDIPLGVKISRYLQNYAYGLSPQYWFIPNTHDLIRHRMQGMGQIATWMLPFFITGLVIAALRIRESAYRTVLLMALAVPAGAATLEITITRVLPFIVPATMLVILGLDWLRERFLQKLPLVLVFAALLGLFGLSGAWALRTALTQGPLWTDDYGLYGLQFGARQVFVEALPEYLAQTPNAHVYVSSTWANGTDNFARFFLTPQEQARVTMTGIDTFTTNKLAINPDDLFVLTAQEYPKVAESGKFKEVAVQKIINYPNGRPGFFLVKLAYVDDIDAILAAEKEELRKPIEGEVEINGQVVKITYARIDMGQPKDLFDGNLFSLMRGAEANPYVLELTYPEPRAISGLVLDLATMDYEVIVSLFPPGDETPTIYRTTGEQITTDAHIEMAFENGPDRVERIILSIRNLRTGDYANVHIRELQLLP